MNEHSEYTSPFTDRYYTPGMSRIFSDNNRYTLWRMMWIWLAKAQQMCGLGIDQEQIEEMVLHINDIPYDRVSGIESETKHDVVAHLRAFAEQCPKASPIIHLGATSCYITDNTDVIIMHDAAEEISAQLKSLLMTMLNRAEEFAGYAIVGRTHFQPAQPVSLGRRIAMWAQDFMIDMENLTTQTCRLRPLGCRGATGTADSFLKLFDGDYTKVRQMEQGIVRNMGFGGALDISGQTYTRKQDYYLLQVLSGIAQSATKMATDIRLMSGLGEIYEEFGSSQVGSSAMPYKKNPITCEKICGLSRYVINTTQNSAWTAASQWLERSLDDSSNRRVVIPEVFMATSALLQCCENVVSSMQVNDTVVKSEIDEFTEKAICEAIITECVRRGKDRQKIHEKLRKHYTGDNPLTSITHDPDIGINAKELLDIMHKYHDHPCGASAEQVYRFVRRCKRELQGQAT